MNSGTTGATFIDCGAMREGEPGYAEMLRKRADELEARARAEKKRRKAVERGRRRKEADIERARQTLIAVMADESRGFARVEAARTLLDLAMHAPGSQITHRFTIS